MTPFGDVGLAKKILKDERVLTIVGMHTHRIQGYVGYKHKGAYMCLGNFLFPNFYIKLPTQIYYPKKGENTNSFPVTRQYHQVFKRTYKKWRLANRVSIVLQFDTLTNRVSHKFVKQRDSEPIVEDLGRFQSLYYSAFINWLSCLYSLPKGLYKASEYLNTKAVYPIWINQIRMKLIRQLGVKRTIESIVRKVKKG